MKEKRASTAQMFDKIAFRYDFLNHFLSLGIDKLWRRRAIRTIGKLRKNPEILDVATGTGDLAIAAMKLDPLHITGIDISEKMLEIGKRKIREKGLETKIELLNGDSEKIGFDGNSFDVVMVAFGVRNFSDPARGLSEMHRVLRNNGMIMVLEFSKPEAFPLRQLYFFYFLKVLPVAGRLFSKDKNAYTYLPESVMQFPDNENFVNMLKEAGFKDASQKKLTGGIVSIYTGRKF